jgi:diguanylate cyclase (GGDEF)-like protein
MPEAYESKSTSMTGWRRPSQRQLFSGLVAVILLVLVGSFTFASLDSYRRHLQLAEEEVLVKARLLATAHDQWLSEMNNLMAAMAAGLSNIAERQDGCRQLFSDYLKISQGIDTILLVAPSGDLLCAATPFTSPVNFSDRRYFQRAMAKKAFAVGNFIIGRVSGERVLPMALPVLDDAGEVAFLLVVGRRLDWIEKVLGRQYLGGDIAVTVVDGDGTVLAHGPQASVALERPHPVAALRRAIREEASGVFTAQLDGLEQIIAYTRLGPAGSDVYVLASQPVARGLEPTLSIIRDNLLQLLLTMLLVIAALWFGIGHWVLKPLQQLTDTMGRVRAGSKGTRVVGMGPSRELAAIGDSFNDMLDTLEETGRQLKQLADSDALLGIPNRRRLNEQMHNEWRRLARRGEPLSLLMVDVDLFKHYNDYYGHQAGDECLKGISAVLRGVLHRPADMLARYGGEEFVLLLPETDEEGARRIADEIHAAMAQRHIPHAASSVADYVTLSIGLATTIPSPQGHVDRLLERADKALYQAKSGGRNRTESA